MCPLGLGKGSWKRANDQSTGTESERFKRSRQPFWQRGNAPASYFMKRCLAMDDINVDVVAKWLLRPVRACAPCHASQYPWYSQEELGETFLGHPLYLKPKGEGESSIVEKPPTSDRR